MSDKVIQEALERSNTLIDLQRLDHLVLTVSDVEATCQFYSQVLGCEIVTFSENRRALRIGESAQKINLHPAKHPFRPAAEFPQPVLPICALSRPHR